MAKKKTPSEIYEELERAIEGREPGTWALTNSPDGHEIIKRLSDGCYVVEFDAEAYEVSLDEAGL